MSLPVVAIVGRPNVGKSTLFNRMVGRRQAIVTDQPGVTRDRQYGEVDRPPLRCRLVDTGGLTPNTVAPFAETSWNPAPGPMSSNSIACAEPADRIKSNRARISSFPFLMVRSLLSRSVWDRLRHGAIAREAGSGSRATVAR